MTAGRLGLVGSDLARPRALGPRRRRLLPVALAVALLAALTVAALRIDLIRVRYGLGDALRQEKALLEEHRQALARLRALRDPARLGRLAADRGLGRPDRLIELPARAPRRLDP